MMQASRVWVWVWVGCEGEEGAPGTWIQPLESHLPTPERMTSPAPLWSQGNAPGWGTGEKLPAPLRLPSPWYCQ